MIRLIPARVWGVAYRLGIVSGITWQGGRGVTGIRWRGRRPFLLGINRGHGVR